MSTRLHVRHWSSHLLCIQHSLQTILPSSSTPQLFSVSRVLLFIKKFTREEEDFLPFILFVNWIFSNVTKALGEERWSGRMRDQEYNQKDETWRRRNEMKYLIRVGFISSGANMKWVVHVILSFFFVRTDKKSKWK